MSSEPLENRLESEKDELLLAGQERSSGWICTSTMTADRGLSLSLLDCYQSLGPACLARLSIIAYNTRGNNHYTDIVN